MSTFSSKMTISNSTECAEFVSLICHGVKGDKVTLSDVNKTKQLLVNIEKVQPKLTQNESARDMSNMMFQDDIVTPKISHYMVNLLIIVDNIFSSNFHPLIEVKIKPAATKQHENYLFVQPTVDEYPICSLPYSVTPSSKMLKVC